MLLSLVSPAFCWSFSLYPPKKRFNCAEKEKEIESSFDIIPQASRIDSFAYHLQLKLKRHEVERNKQGKFCVGSD